MMVTTAVTKRRAVAHFIQKQKLDDQLQSPTTNMAVSLDAPISEDSFSITTASTLMRIRCGKRVLEVFTG